ncbi:MAG: HupE/UreJ family protein [Acaryochloridaceae cyanobacterium SU_2_1]|nr:HupE/UreJ family protein [Acaryochloridaceae cyanobacterium SU_2_1]
MGLVILAYPEVAVAHHALGGKTPQSFLSGFISGLAHPIIGIDHFAFVVAAGLLALLCGIWVPLAFVGCSVLGTAVHLQSLNLPVPELFIAGSVLIFGILLALKQHPNPLVTTGLAAIAGLFHGYAYGESIVGAQLTALVAYLSGFTVIQLGIATLAYRVGKAVCQPQADQPSLPLRFAGCVIGGMGVAFLSSALLG